MRERLKLSERSKSMTRAPKKASSKAAARTTATRSRPTVSPAFPIRAMSRSCTATKPPRQTLRDAFDSGRMHHGWLLTGLEGVGKASLAYAFARYVLASPAERATAPAGRLAVDPQSTAARQISARSHPGLLVIRRMADAKTKRISSVIRVDEVRRLKSFLQLTAERGQLAGRHRRSRR